jgi:Zn-dependent M28 family amino/carboxypeptidase
MNQLDVYGSNEAPVCGTTIPKYWFAISAFVILAASVALLIAGAVVTKTPALPTPGPVDPLDAFAASVTTSNILRTLKQLEAIAMKPGNGGSRSVELGYMDSVSYFKQQLEEYADCDISTQQFGVPFFAENASPLARIVSPSLNYTLQSRTDLRTMTFGGNETVDLEPTAIYVAERFGCNATADFDRTKANGKIVMVWYNSDDDLDCTAYEKALNAFHSGARAILIANDETRHSLSASRLRGTGYSPGLYEFVTVPTLAISYMTASTLANLEGAAMALKASTTIRIVQTESLFCTTRSGNPQNLLVFGAHLDSVTSGPGINDNGSGASTLLEIAKQLKAQGVTLANQIQFSWWGAEEPGQFGSRYFVNHTQVENPALWARIKASLNFDTIASPNGIPQVYNIHLKNEQNETFPQTAFNGSAAINGIFTHRFNERNQPFLEIAFEGGSDYYSFVQHGIPTGGLDSGAADTLTVEQAKIFGGLQNAVMDPCYHESCDKVDNLGLKMLDIMADAAAYTIARLGTQSNLDDFLAAGQ